MDNDELAFLMKALLARLEYERDSDELYKDYLLRWFETYKKPVNVPHTSDFMLNYINNRIIPALGDYPLSRLSGDYIQSYLNSITKANTRIKIGQIIHGSLSKACKLRLLRYNPFDAVEVPGYQKKHYRALTLNEQTLLYDSIKNRLYYSVFWILLCTGMRIGEFLAIDKSCIDKENMLIKVYRSVDISSGELRSRVKTYGSIRNIPYIKPLLLHLNYVVNYVDVHGYLTYNQIKLYFRKMYKKLGITGLAIHSYRHTFGCMCYAVGISEKMIQRLMGHASLDVTMNVYVDVLGSGDSPFLKYFRAYEKDLKSRPSDFWRFVRP